MRRAFKGSASERHSMTIKIKRNPALLRTGSALLTAALMTGVCTAVLPARDVSAAAYDSAHTQQISWYTTLQEIFQKNTNAKGVYREMKTAMRYGVLNEQNIYQLYLDPATTIPVEAIRLLYQDGLVSSFLYKLIAAEPLTAADLKDVYDPAYYYGANTAINQALPYDEALLFQNFLTCGMAVGLQGNSEFNLSVYKANYPELTAAFGNNNTAYYQYYILFGKKAGQKAAVKIKK